MQFCSLQFQYTLQHRRLFILIGKSTRIGSDFHHIRPVGTDIRYLSLSIQYNSLSRNHSLLRFKQGVP